VAIDRKTLMMTSPQFTSALVREEKLALGRYDMRLKGGNAASPTEARNTVILRYLRNELQFQTDLAYQGIDDGYTPATSPAPAGIGSRWVWGQVDNTSHSAVSNVGSGDGPPPAQPWLRLAMTIHPALKVFLVAGPYDLLNSWVTHSAAGLRPEHYTRLLSRWTYDV